MVRLPIVTVLILSLSSILPVIPARANIAPNPGDLGTQWVSTGPFADRLLFQIYSGATSEFNDFQGSCCGSGLDVPDALVRSSLVDTFRSDPRYLVTGPVRQYNLYGIDFNMTNTFWGVPFSHGVDPTGRSQNIRQGIAHLIGRSGFISQYLAGAGDRADCFAPRLQIIQGRILCPGPWDPSVPANGDIPSWNVCSWEQAFIASHPELGGCQGAYDLGSQIDAHGAVLVGSPDFCAAADHFIAAGLATGKDGSCVLTGLSSAANGQTITLEVPQSESGKMLKGLGDTLTYAINELMANAQSPAVVECGWSSTGWSDSISTDFTGAVRGGTEDLAHPTSPGGVLAQDFLDAISGLVGACASESNWGMAVSGWKLSQNIDQLYSVYNSEFSFNAYSNPLFDHWTNMLEFNSTLSGAQQSAQAAEYIMGSDAVEIPIWSDAGDYAYLNGWRNVVNQQGVGISNYWTALNGWNTNPPAWGPTIRWGFQEGTETLNVFRALSHWDVFVLREVYDTLFASNPYNPDQLFGWMAYGYSFVTASSDHNCPMAVAGCLKINLRGDIFFQDGLQATASDVKFSILNFHPSGVVDVLYSQTILPTSLGGNGTPGTSETMYITLSQNSPLILDKIAKISIVPQHVWHCKVFASSGPEPCYQSGTEAGSSVTGPCLTKGTPQCSVDPSYLTGPTSDPVANNMLIGSGPFVCAPGPYTGPSTPGLGGGCTSSGTGSVTTGTITLQRYGSGLTPANSGYFRGNANYKQYLWADVNGDGQVNAIDISLTSGCQANFGSNPTACNHLDGASTTLSCTSAGPCIGASSGGDNDGAVTGFEKSQVLRWYNTFWNSPFSYSSLQGVLPAPPALQDDGSTYS